MTRRGRSTSHCVWLVAGAIAAGSTLAAAQTFYKWTDERGTVHFSDAPPPQSNGVEVRNLPPPPAAPAKADGVTEGKPEDSATDAGRKEGPARVVILSRRSPRTGPTTMHIEGKVKNVGGEAAQNVSVTINVADSGQGNPCLSQDVTVTPANLPPGQSGDFKVDLESPCLNGEPSLDVALAWD